MQGTEVTQLLFHSCRYGHVALLSAFAIADVDAQRLAVNVGGSEPDCLSQTQAAMVDECEKDPEALEPGRSDHGTDLLAREHPWQAFGPPHPNRLPQGPIPPKVIAEERAQAHNHQSHRGRRIIAHSAKHEQEIRDLPLREDRWVELAMPRNGDDIRQVALLRAGGQIFEFDEADELGYRKELRIFFFIDAHSTRCPRNNTQPKLPMKTPAAKRLSSTIHRAAVSGEAIYD